MRGAAVREDDLYTVVLPEYHARNAKDFIGVSGEELEARAGAKVVATSAQDVLREYLRSHPNLTSRVEGRLKYVE